MIHRTHSVATPARRVSAAVALAAMIVHPAQSLHAQSANAPPATIGAADPRIDSLFTFVAPDAPGCAVGIYRNGALAWARGYGLASIEHAVPISQRTAFDIGSTSKQFTAALTVMLANEGRVSLDAPVRKYVPELAPWGDTVTVRQLLHHTGGVRDYIGLMRFAGISTHDLTTQDDAVKIIARQRALDFAPGTQHSYSNSGYLLLAEIVSRTEGKPLAVVARERLFEPLGMTSTLYLDSYNRVIPHRATGYTPADSGFTVNMSNWQQVGDGAVITTVEDLARWVNHLDGGRGQALARDLEAQASLNGKPLYYARGVMIDSTRGVRRVRHGGSWAGFNAELVRLPARQLAVSALCNREDANPVELADQITELLLDDMKVARVGNGGAASTSSSVASAKNPAPTPVPNANAYVGSYLGGGFTLRVQARGDTLYVSPGSPFLPLRRADTARFEVIGAPVLAFIQFFRGASGMVDSAEVDAAGRKTMAIRSDDSTRLPAIVERSLVGEWYSDELDTRWRISVDSARVLTLHMPRREGLRLRVLRNGRLVSEGGTTMRIERNANGLVDAIVVDSQRAKGLRFVRAQAR